MCLKAFISDNKKRLINVGFSFKQRNDVTICTYLFTYLFSHYNVLQVLASANFRCHTSRAIAAWRQFRILSVVTFSSNSLAQRWRGRPFLRLRPPGSDSNTLRTGLDPYERHDAAIEDVVN